MRNRLRVIAMSYVTRRANWVFVVFGFVAILFAVHLVHQRPSMRSVVPRFNFWTSAYLKLDHKRAQQQFQAMGKPREQESTWPPQWDWKAFGDAERLCITTGPEIPWDKIRGMKKLRQIHMKNYRLQTGSASSTSDLRELSKITQLEYLALPPFEQFSEAEIHSLKSLHNLRWLDLQDAKLSGGLESLPDFPQLETLFISSVQDLTDRALDRLKRYPKLQTLVVHQSGHDLLRWSENNPAEMNADRLRVERLQSLPSIKTLYVPGRERSAIEEFAKQTRPDASVYPTTADATRAPVFFPFVIALILFATPVFHSMSGQFSRPEALLTPGYRTPHLLLGISLIAIVTGIGTLTLWYGGVHPLMGNCLAIATLSVYGIIWYPSTMRYAVFLFPASFMLALQLVAWNPAKHLVRELFLGELSVFAGGVGVFGVSLLAFLFTRSVNLHRYLTAAGQATSLLGYRDLHGDAGNPVKAYASPKLGQWLIRWLHTPAQRLAESTASFRNDDVASCFCFPTRSTRDS